MTDANSETRKILEEIETLSRQKPECAKLLSLHRDILLCQREEEEKFQVSEIKNAAALASQCVAEGVPILKKLKPAPDVDAAQRLFHSLKNALRKHSAEIDRQVALIDEAAATGKIDLRKMLISAFGAGSSETIRQEAQKAHLDSEFLALLVASSVKPNLQKYSRTLLPEIDTSLWLRPECPVCGCSPAISFLEREEGKRILLCSMCSARWRYPRLKCLFCGNEDQNTLKVLFPGATTSAYRADVCEKCKRYIKVVDLRKTPSKTISEVEDWATIEIDLLAEREGFIRNAKSATSSE